MKTLLLLAALCFPAQPVVKQGRIIRITHEAGTLAAIVELPGFMNLWEFSGEDGVREDMHPGDSVRVIVPTCDSPSLDTRS